MSAVKKEDVVVAGVAILVLLMMRKRKEQAPELAGVTVPAPVAPAPTLPCTACPSGAEPKTEYPGRPVWALCRDPYSGTYYCALTHEHLRVCEEELGRYLSDSECREALSRVSGVPVTAIPPSPAVVPEAQKRGIKYLNYGEVYRVDTAYCIQYNAPGIGGSFCGTSGEVQAFIENIKSTALSNIAYVDRYLNYANQGYCVCQCAYAKYVVQPTCELCRSACDFQGGFVKIYSVAELEAEKDAYRKMLEDYNTVLELIK